MNGNIKYGNIVFTFQNIIHIDVYIMYKVTFFDNFCSSRKVGFAHDEQASTSQKQHPAVKKKLSFAPKTRRGMTVCSDHGWQKRGFDSLTGDWK